MTFTVGMVVGIFLAIPVLLLVEALLPEFKARLDRRAELRPYRNASTEDLAMLHRALYDAWVRSGGKESGTYEFMRAFMGMLRELNLRGIA